MKHWSCSIPSKPLGNNILRKDERFGEIVRLRICASYKRPHATTSKNSWSQHISINYVWNTIGIAQNNYKAVSLYSKRLYKAACKIKKQYSDILYHFCELHLVNPHSLKQITHGHLNVTTTIANRCYRPGPNKYFISTTRVTFSTKLLHPDPIESVARLRQQLLKCGPKASLSGECHRTVI